MKTEIWEFCLSHRKFPDLMAVEWNGIDLIGAIWICKSWSTPVGCIRNVWFVASLFNIHDYSSHITIILFVRSKSHVWNPNHSVSHTCEIQISLYLTQVIWISHRVIWISYMWFGSHKQNNRDMWWVIMNIKQWRNKPKISNATHRSWSRFTYPNRSHQINSISINTHQIRTKPVTHKLFPNFCFHRKIESNWIQRIILCTWSNWGFMQYSEYTVM